MKLFPEIPGCDLYLAGGCVRDEILGRQYHDRDFVVMTDMTIEQLQGTIDNMPNSQVYLAKPEFMTLRCKIRGEDIDLTYPRTESGYADGRHPNVVSVANTLEEDSIRRDFTMNAMYLTREGLVIDYHTGRQDIKSAIITTVRHPEVTFGDDYLRMARAWRFACTLGNEWHIAQPCIDSIRINVSRLRDVPVERVREEINKGLLANAQKMFNYLTNSHALEILLSRGLTFMVTSKER